METESIRRLTIGIRQKSQKPSNKSQTLNPKFKFQKAIGKEEESTKSQIPKIKLGEIRNHKFKIQTLKRKSGERSLKTE